MFENEIMIIYFKIIKLPDNFPSGLYNLTILGTGQNGYEFENFTQDIQYNSDTYGFYMMTDRKTYKQSDLG